jgi:pimeloyl-ACP methyl ester carboxylesterase
MREPVRVRSCSCTAPGTVSSGAATAAGSARHVEAPYRWRLLDGAAHFPHEEVPAAFSAELLGWLDDPSPTDEPGER